jgi:UDP-N-acetylglucosamine--N-acetylmuramyl-(pentapeptide) pyrophosphoryl-undecaprenol N-acetylglucosamine transferase
MARDRTVRVRFVGSQRPLERQLVEAHGFAYQGLELAAASVLRQNPFRFGWTNWRACRTALQMVDHERPRIIIGLGGLASVPLVLAASRRKIPLLLLEQNVIPGRATRWLSRLAHTVCTTFDETARLLPTETRIVRTGNPVREEIAALTTAPPEMRCEASTLLILGGSQGATGLNRGVLQLIEEQATALRNWQIVHQTGTDQYPQVREFYDRLQLDCVVEPFFHDLSAWYRRATIVISRAGATTLAELACAGLPAILVPYPHAADNHQVRNAEVLAEAGGGVVVLQGTTPEQTAERLSRVLLPLMADERKRQEMRNRMRRQAEPEAGERVVQEIDRLTGG